MSQERNSSPYRRNGHSGRSRREREFCNHDGSTLYVSNLPILFTSADMKEVFQKFGILQDYRIINNPITRESRGFGFVSYKYSKDADDAQQSIDGKEFDGKHARVEKAKRNRPHEPTPGHYRGPPGASIKYDSRGRLKPGFMPFYACPPPRGAGGDDRSSCRSNSRGRSPRNGRLDYREEPRGDRGGYRGGDRGGDRERYRHRSSGSERGYEGNYRSSGDKSQCRKRGDSSRERGRRDRGRREESIPSVRVSDRERERRRSHSRHRYR